MSRITPPPGCMRMCECLDADSTNLASDHLSGQSQLFSCPHVAECNMPGPDAACASSAPVLGSVQKERTRIYAGASGRGMSARKGVVEMESTVSNEASFFWWIPVR